MAACFTLDGIQPNTLPVGAVFRVAYAPAADMPMTESQRGWCVVTFTVVELQDIRPPYALHRMYRDDGWERVTAEEAAHWFLAQGSMIRDEGTAI